MAFQRVLSGIFRLQLFLLFLNAPVFAQNAASAQGIEKIYAHLDRDSYRIGERLWLKCYIVNESGKLSGLSKIVYVDLIDGENKVRSSLKLPVAGGLANGDFLLTDTLQPGRYRLRAYTRWMRNEDDRYFFNRFLTIDPKGTDRLSLIKEQPALSGSPNVRFFAEGGNMISDIPGKVVIKVSDVRGRGLQAEGYVVDTKSARVAEFKTAHGGVGSFQLTPFPGESYSAVLKLQDGSEVKAVLPQVLPEGYSLRLTGVGENALRLRVYNARTAKTPAVLKLQTQTGFVHVAEVPTGRAFVDVVLPKAQVPSGVLNLILQDGGGKTLAGRLAFIEEDPLTVKLLPSSSSSANGQVNYNFSVSDVEGKPVSGTFSVSVRAISPDSGYGSSILSALQLESELVAPVEGASYYFDEPSVEKWRQLDDLMLTQQWRFTNLGQSGTKLISAESGISLSGQILRGTRPVANEGVTMLSLNRGMVLESKTDKEGRFTFSDLVFAGSERFVVQIKDEKNRANTTFTFDEESAPAVRQLVDLDAASSPTGLFAVIEKTDTIETKSAGQFKGQVLGEVKVTAQRIIKPERSSMLGGQPADYLISSASFEGMQYLDDALRGRIPGLNFIVDPQGQVFAYLMRNQSRTTGAPVVMQVYMDGMPMGPGSDLKSISLSNIDNIEVLVRSNTTAIYGPNAAGGLLLINTKIGPAKDTSYRPNEPNGTALLEGYTIGSDFTDELSASGAAGGSAAGMGGTIYWNPSLFSSEKGELSLEFNPGSHRSYQVLLEGIDEFGRPLRKEFKLRR